MDLAEIQAILNSAQAVLNKEPAANAQQSVVDSTTSENKEKKAAVENTKVVSENKEDATKRIAAGSNLLPPVQDAKTKVAQLSGSSFFKNDTRAAFFGGGDAAQTSAAIVQEDTDAIEYPDGQLFIEGYNKPEPIALKSEKKAQQELAERVPANFEVNFESEEPESVVEREKPDEPEETQEAEEILVDEYRQPEDKDGFNRSITKLANRMSGKAFGSACLLIFGVVLAVLSFGGESVSTENTTFSMGANVICMVILFYLCNRDMKGGLRLVFSSKRDNDSALALAFGLGAAISFLPLFSDFFSVRSAVVYSLPVLIFGFWNTVSKNVLVQNLQRNFNEWAISRGDKIYSVHAVKDRKHAAELAVALDHRTKDSPILVSQKVEFPANFKSCGDDTKVADKFYRYLVPGAFGYALIIAAILYFKHNDWATIIAILPAAFTAILPFALFAAHTIPLYGIRSRLAKENAMLASVTAAQELAESDVLAIDAAELFQREDCSLLGMIPSFSNSILPREDILALASILREMDSPAVNGFYGTFTLNDGEKIPALREVRIENSGIYGRLPYDLPNARKGQLVHLGTYDFMNSHEIKNISQKAKNAVLNYPQRKVLYFAVGGEFSRCLMFYYSPAPPFPKLLANLKDGLQLLVATRDPNIKGSEIAQNLKLTQGNFASQNAVKIAHTRAEETFQQYRLEALTDMDAKAFHDGSAFSCFSLLHAARALSKGAKRAITSQLLVLITAGLMFALCLALGMDPVSAVLLLSGVQFFGAVGTWLVGRGW